MSSLEERREAFKRYKRDVQARGKPFFPYAMFHDTVMSLVVVATIAVLAIVWYYTADGTEAGWLGKLYDEKANPGTTTFPRRSIASVVRPDHRSACALVPTARTLPPPNAIAFARGLARSIVRTSPSTRTRSASLETTVGARGVRLAMDSSERQGHRNGGEKRFAPSLHLGTNRRPAIGPPCGATTSGAWTCSRPAPWRGTRSPCSRGPKG